jgi:hypothetical protein
MNPQKFSQMILSNCPSCVTNKLTFKEKSKYWEGREGRRKGGRKEKPKYLIIIILQAFCFHTNNCFQPCRSAVKMG